jgi:hypothetical protein
MIKKIKPRKILFLASAVLCSLSIPAMAGGETYSPEIREVEVQVDSSIKVTFIVLTESMWFCPGADGKKSGKDIELTFERALYNKRPKVDYPAKSVSKGDMSKVITIPAPFESVFLRDGKKLVKIYPAPDKK